MSRQIALLIYISLIAFLFWYDRDDENCSRSTWIPQIWILIAGSRFFSYWLNILGIHVEYASSITEGSPTDAVFFNILIIAGVIILAHRKIDWHKFFAENPFVWVFFLYGAVSIIWSDYPYVSTKRLIKAFGNLVMVLLILTEQKPYEALGVILRRTAFILLPLSILFIKYYPELGRAYHMGKPLFLGVTTQKNSLGELCLICGIYFVWNLIFNKKMNAHLNASKKLSVNIIILSMVFWLLLKADSATSLMCMIIAVAILIVAAHPIMIKKPHNLLSFSIGAGVILAIIIYLFDFWYIFINALGRRPDLTSRVPMWQDLISMAIYPITGFGFESFWLGDRREYMAKKWGITISAHNGYLEMYLNLGIIGIFFILCWALGGIRRVKRHLKKEYSIAVLRLCIIVIVLLFNWTEATFYGVNNMWVLFFLAIIDPPNLALMQSNLAKNK